MAQRHEFLFEQKDIENSNGELLYTIVYSLMNIENEKITRSTQKILCGLGSFQLF